MQLWPANENALAASFDAASSRSASASTITGVALPSSSATFLRAARSRSFQPTSEEPVNVISFTRSSSTRTSPISAARAREDVEPTRGQAGLVLELGEQQRRERRLGGRLQHDGAARGERRSDLVRDEVEREVERGDCADHTDRAAQRERELPDAGLRRIHRHHVARRASAPRRLRTCTSTSRVRPRRGRPSSAFRPRPRSSALPRRAACRGSRRRVRGSPRACAPAAARPWPPRPRRSRAESRRRRPWARVPRRPPSTATAPRSTPRSRPTRRRRAASSRSRVTATSAV